MAWAALGVVLAVAAGAWWFTSFRPDHHRYPVRGIDVSHHQGVIDWAAVARDDIAFAYLKASEGADHRDDAFAGNWKAARAAGLRVGAYHYFTFCRSGAAQAANFLTTVPHAADALPPVVDLEFGGNCQIRPGPEALRAQLAAFLGPVEAREGKPAIFYATQEFLAAYGEALPDRRVWRRSIALEPARGERWVFWQYHNRGRVSGVKGPVDLNVFSGKPGGLARLAAD
ncbi:MAG TPA: GH25 family lysozyme [Caulobacteraceae bacterium]|nr:GH25 family lysozyme [Caulobacteraceae bacterium]